jgi:hypothetical protein
MGRYRISRSITVNATHCTKAETIATDLGFTNVKPGDWIINGEEGETYILSNEFFQRTFAPAEEQSSSRQTLETHPSLCRTRLDMRRHRPPRPARKRSLPMH